MVINDRLTRGFVSGVVAGIIQDALDYIAHLADITSLRYIDWVGIIILGSKPNTAGEKLLALAGELFFSGVLGILFSFLILSFTSKNLILKGWLYGVTIWFGTYGIMTLFRVKGLEFMDVYTASSDIVTSSVYGITLAYTLKWLDRKAD